MVRSLAQRSGHVYWCQCGTGATSGAWPSFVVTTVQYIFSVGVMGYSIERTVPHKVYCIGHVATVLRIRSMVRQVRATVSHILYAVLGGIGHVETGYIISCAVEIPFVNYGVKYRMH